MRVSDRLDRLPLGRFHYRVLILSGLGWMFDSMDVGLVSFAAARLRDEWSLSSSRIALVLNFSLLGMFLGGALAGALADRFGRKTIFQVTLLVFSIGTGLCGLSWGLASLLGLRLVVGLGLGGELPVAASLVSEFAPARHRGRLVVLLESFWALGSLAAAMISNLLVPWAEQRGLPFPWRLVFFIGALPALYVLVLRRVLPESPRFLIAKGRRDEAEAVLRCVEAAGGAAPPGRPTEPLESGQETGAPARVGVRELFGPGLRRRTIMLWILWFAMGYSYYGIFSWLPTLLVKQGFAIAESFRFTLYIILAQIPGYFAAAYLVERIGRRATLVSFMTLCAAASYFFGTAPTSGSIVAWGCLVSFFNLGAWGVTYGYTPELYPTRVRATGTGWAAALTRVGGFLAMLAVGLLLDASGAGLHAVFGMFAGVLALGAAGVVVLGEETRGRSLEEISG
ncbi:MAG: MFS transporter [Acidobacteriota bacterium]